MRACIVQGSQQIWVAALWYWGYSLNGREDGYIPPWWICLIVWPLACMSFLFAYVMLYGLPEYYRQTPPKVPHFLKTLFRRKLVLWFLASEILRDYWLSGVSNLPNFIPNITLIFFLALRTQLEFPLGCASTKMANSSPCRRIFRRRLGNHAASSHTL